VALTALHAAYEGLAACGIDTLTREELLAVTDELEILDCQLPTQRHRLLTQLQTQATPGELGAKSWREVLMIRWRLSSTEAHRRLAEAAVWDQKQVWGEMTPQALDGVQSLSMARLSPS
jgi:hypothetical protein